MARDHISPTDEFERFVASLFGMPINGRGFVVDVRESLLEIVGGLFWPINAPLRYISTNWRTAQWVKAIEIVAIVAGVTAIFFEIADRREERLVRMWNLATDQRPGNSGKNPALEYLNKLGKPLTGISIPKAYLQSINLSGADLSGADLSKADLSGADLSNTNLTGANLSGVDLRWTDLRESHLYRANLSGANLIGANLSKAYFEFTNLTKTLLTALDYGWDESYPEKGITQDQLDEACVDKDGKPALLLESLKPPTQICSEW